MLSPMHGFTSMNECAKSRKVLLINVIIGVAVHG